MGSLACDGAEGKRTLNDAGAAPDSDRHGNGPVEKRPRTQGSPGHDQEDVEDGSDHSFFCATLKRGGIDVRGLSKLGAGGQADGANAVPTFVNAAASAASVRQNLEKSLQFNGPARDRFIQGMKEHLEDAGRLRASLLPIRAVDQRIRSDSLVKVLLRAGLEFVQPALVACLFDRIPEFFDDEDENGMLNDSISRLILSQFKWLDTVTRDSKVTDQLLDLVEIAPLHIKREAIGIIPEVAADEDHEQVVERLRLQLDHDPLCTNVVLDAFSNLTLDEILLVDVADKVMDLVRSAEPCDLPVVVRYLVQSCSGSAMLAGKTVAALRNHLNFFSASEHDHEQAQGQALTLDALCSGLKFRKHLVVALLEQIRQVDNVDSHRPFDIWALITMRESGDPKRQADVDRLFKKKITDRMFRPGFIRDSIAKNGSALRPYFKQICLVAESLMKAHDDGIAAFGTEIYQVLFEVFRDDSSRQEILGNIVSHTGGGDGASADAALDVLVHIARHQRGALRPFAVFIKGILDYLDNLKPHHIRKLFGVLTMISISNDSGARELDDDVQIYIRKLLSSHNGKYMQHGIIGAVSAVVALSTVFRTDRLQSQGAEESAEENQFTAGGRDRSDQALHLLETVKSKCEVTPRASVFLYDELSSALIAVRGHIDCRIKASALDWMKDNLTSTLEDTYLHELPEDDSDDPQDAVTMTKFCATPIKDFHSTLTLQGAMNLDADMAQVLLNPVKILVDIEGGEMLQRMCAMLRLVGAMEWATTGSIESIDALAGCPILLFHDDHIQDFKLLEPHEQTDIALLLFHVSNWIIEVLNTFCLDPASELKKKMVHRTNHLLQILTTLQKVLEQHDVQLPDLNRSLESDAVPGASSSKSTGSVQAKAKAKAMAKGKAKGSDGQSKSQAPAKKGKGKGKGQQTGSDDSEESSAGGSRALMSKKGRDKSTRRDDDDEEEEGPGEFGAPIAQKGGGASANNNNKSLLQLSSATGLYTQLTAVRDQSKFFRELDLTVHNVLAFSCNPSSLRARAAAADDAGDEQAALDDRAVLALVQDMWSKVDGIVSQRRAFPWGKGGREGASRREVDPTSFFNNMRSIWHALCLLFDSAAKRLGATEETMDIDMLQAPDDILQQILLTIMAIIDRSLECTEYLGPHRDESQLVMLSAFVLDGQGVTSACAVMQDESEVHAAAVGAYNFFNEYVQQMPSFRLASALIFLQTKIAEKVGEGGEKQDDVKQALSEQALWCLTSSQWGNDTVTEREAVTRLLRCYVSRHKEPIDCINKVSVELLPEFDPDDVREDVQAEGFCRMSGRSFPAIFNVLLEHTTQCFAEIEKTAVDTEKHKQDPAALVARLHTSVEAFDRLIKFSKNWDRDSSVLHACIKFGNKVVLSFTKIVPYLQRSFKTQQEEIKTVIKQLQGSTRALQHICAHAKVEKDQRVFKLVPQVRRNLEAMLFKVKALAETMGCLAAFSVGNLKHRNLQGQEVSSQVVDDDESASDEEEGEEEGEEDSEPPTPRPLRRCSAKGKDAAEEEEVEEEEDEESDTDSENESDH